MISTLADWPGIMLVPSIVVLSRPARSTFGNKVGPGWRAATCVTIVLIVWEKIPAMHTCRNDIQDVVISGDVISASA